MLQTPRRTVSIAILLFDGVTALDAVGPYEVLARLPDATVRLVARELGVVCDGAGGLTFRPTATFESHPRPDVVLVPGGPGIEKACRNRDLLDWLAAAHRTARWTTAVCTGALLLGAAGILEGRRATTHWLAHQHLRTYGAQLTHERVVVDEPVITAAGVSAGIDMALTLAGLLAGDQIAQAIQLSLEYAPEPPYTTGSPATASPELIARVRASAQRPA
jgi:transcriptional regulator GlxA family with amidase domain